MRACAGNVQAGGMGHRLTVSFLYNNLPTLCETMANCLSMNKILHWHASCWKWLHSTFR